MATWKAIVTNTKTKKTTARLGSNCPVENVVYEAMKAAEEETPVKDLPDSWTVNVSLVKGK